MNLHHQIFGKTLLIAVFSFFSFGGIAQNKRDTLHLDSLVDILTDRTMGYQERIDSFISARSRGGVHVFLPYSCEKVGEAMDRLIESARTEEDRLSMMMQRGYMALHCDSLNQQIKLYEEIVNLSRELNDLPSETSAYEWLSQVYTRNSLSDKALEYSLKAARTMARREDLDSVAVSHHLSRSGYGLMMAAVEREDTILLDSALIYTKLAYEHSFCKACDRMEPTIVYAMNLVRIGDQKGAAAVMKEGYEFAAGRNDDFYVMRFARQLSDVYSNLGAYNIALEYIRSAIEIDQKSISTDNPEVFVLKEYGPVNMVNIYFLYGVYVKKGDYSAAVDILDQVYFNDADYSKSSAAKGVIDRAAGIYARAGKFKKATELYEIALDQARNQAQDISNRFAETNRAHTLVQMDLQRKRNEADHARRQALVERERDQQRNIKYALIGGSAILVIFLLFVYNRFRKTKKQKIIIEAQKQTVEETLGELEVKNKEILDSIAYAKRLQEAILPPIEHFSKEFTDAFVYYRPKDIIAGDFYFMERVDDVLYIAAADCTGHGVPGAMVSVVCANALQKAITEDRITDPGKILDRTRELVMKQFERHGGKIKDGMDICLVTLNGNKLQYAGANNPLWIIRDAELIEVKANKQPIGQHIVTDSFTSHALQIEQGDQVYLFSDGYYDQFGGEKGKKFKPQRMQELLIESADRSMEEQMAELDKEFLDWKGGLEQIDDVCVIGLKL